MQVTIDSREPLERVLPVINALYSVSLSVSETPAPTADAAPATPRRARSSSKATPKAAGRRSKRAAVSPGTVREWARSNGYTVSSRGRLSAELVEAYRAAN